MNNDRGRDPIENPDSDNYENSQLALYLILLAIRPLYDQEWYLS